MINRRSVVSNDNTAEGSPARERRLRDGFQKRARPLAQQALVIELVERGDDGRVELSPAQAVNLVDCLLERPRPFVRPGVCECIEDVAEADDPGAERDRIANEVLRVTLSVPPFVMAERDLLSEL